MYNFSLNFASAYWKTVLVFSVSHFAVWALVGILAMPLMRRYPVRRHWRAWLFHLVVGALFTQFVITLGHLVFFEITGTGARLSFLSVMQVAFETCFHLGMLTYFCFLGVVQMHDAQKLSRQRELQVAEHKAALVHAQLQSLKIQLQPHFLFNTLHAIASLMHYDVDTADRMLNRLSELLRISLQEVGSPVVTLRQEIGFIEAYLDIEKIRFEERLRISWHIPDALLGFEIPPFILQPLVENAIKYGVAPRGDGGSIAIRAHADGHDMLLEVEDDAPATLEAQKGFGIGLRNTRERLDALYGGGKHFDLIRENTRTIARLRIPQAALGERAYA
ncbi:sensor histidine kinase [Massilia glaciei]|uniref:sensor histidine kinase n=1 Tax=Massilia glaciei TaxID=1524097 RepID=UPI0015E7F346|nr:histidine kinase [Massilia glaciei]